MIKNRPLVYGLALTLLLAVISFAYISGFTILTTPFVSTFQYVQTIYFNLIKYHVDPDRAEFEKIKTERNTLLEEVVLLREEIHKLRHMLEIKEDILTDFRTLHPAQVVQTHLGKGDRIYLIQEGTNKGLGKNDVVVSSEGLVGRITATSRYYSQILLIVDRNSSLPALVQKNRLQGIVHGTGSWNELMMELDVPADDVEEGDMIITSGMGVIFPPGILIGYVREILPDRYGLPQRILIEPAVNFRRLEIVGVFPQKTDDEIF